MKKTKKIMIGETTRQKIKNKIVLLGTSLPFLCGIGFAIPSLDPETIFKNLINEVSSYLFYIGFICILVGIPWFIYNCAGDEHNAGKRLLSLAVIGLGIFLMGAKMVATRIVGVTF